MIIIIDIIMNFFTDYVFCTGTYFYREDPKRPEKTRKHPKTPENTRKHPKTPQKTRKDALIYTEKTRKDALIYTEKTRKDPRRPEKTRKDTRKDPKRPEKTFLSLMWASGKWPE